MISELANVTCATFYNRFNKSFVTRMALQTEVMYIDKGQSSLVVSALKDNEIKTAFSLVKDLEKAGDNVGVNEFPDLDYFKETVRYSKTFSLYENNANAKSNELLCAVILITPKFDGYSRSVNPRTATVYIFTSFKTLNLKIDLVKIAEKLTLQVNRGYGACAVNVFYPCQEWISALREQGFLSVLCVQKAGKLSTFPDDMPSYVMYKDLGVGHIPKFSLSQIQEFANHIVGTSTLYASRDIPNLPQGHVLNDGKEVLVRVIRADETKRYYDQFCQSGYGWDEWPTLRGYNIVVEEKEPVDKNKPARWIGAGMIHPSGYSRCHRFPVGQMPTLCDIYYAAGAKEFEGRGFASEIGVLLIYVSISLGYSAGHSDVSMYGIRSLINSFRLPGCIVTGTMPNAVYYADKGWTDTAIVFHEYSTFDIGVDKWLKTHPKIARPKLAKL